MWVSENLLKLFQFKNFIFSCNMEIYPKTYIRREIFSHFSCKSRLYSKDSYTRFDSFSIGFNTSRTSEAKNCSLLENSIIQFEFSDRFLGAGDGRAHQHVRWFSSSTPKERPGLRWVEASFSGHYNYGILSFHFCLLLNFSQERPYIMLKKNHYELDANSKFEGFCIDLLTELSKDLGKRNG